MRRRPRYYLAPAVAFALACAGCLLCMGCILNPGAQVREAMSQTKTYEWTSEGSIRVHGVGPQEEAFVMGEGSIVLNEDGTINLTESRLTHYLRSEPSADEAMAGLTAILLANSEQSKAFYESLESTLELVAAVIPMIAPPTGDGGDESVEVDGGGIPPGG